MGVSKFPEILRKLSMRKQCVPALFSPPTNESLGTRLMDTLRLQGTTCVCILTVQVHTLQFSFEKLGLDV